MLVSGEFDSPTDGTDGRISAFAVVTLPVDTAERRMPPASSPAFMVDQWPAVLALSRGSVTGPVADVVPSGVSDSPTPGMTTGLTAWAEVEVTTALIGV